MANSKMKFVKDAIEKSGFPFEMEIASILKNDGWEIMPSSPYLDWDEEKWREIDIKAYKSFTRTLNGESIEPYRLTIALIIECKKTDEFGWVFFPWPRDPTDMQLTRIKINSIDFLTLIKQQSLLKETTPKSKWGIPTNLPIQEARMLNLDPSLVAEDAMVTPEIARKLKFFSDIDLVTSETFRFLAAKMKALSYKEVKLKELKGSGPHEIFESINALIKATKHDMELCSRGVYAGAQLAKWGKKGEFGIRIFLPLLVFRGDLYTWIDGNVNEADEVLVEGRCHTRSYFDNMLIDVVTAKYFKEFLINLNKDCMGLLGRIYENKQKLDEQVKTIMESPWFPLPSQGPPFILG